MDATSHKTEVHVIKLGSLEIPGHTTTVIQLIKAYGNIGQSVLQLVTLILTSKWAHPFISRKEDQKPHQHDCNYFYCGVPGDLRVPRHWDTYFKSANRSSK